jgi:cytosine/adenosine deaminase-related metal-dependent hydrolase
VTTGAAQLLRLQHAGRFSVGAPADLAVVLPNESCPFDTLVGATRQDVRLTMIDGEPRVAEPSLRRVFAATGVETVPATLDGAPR